MSSSSIDGKKIIKVVTGIVVVPAGIGASLLWPWWLKQTRTVKILTGCFVIPYVTIFGLLSDWWNGY